MKLFLLLASLLAVSHQQSQIPQCDIDINGCVTCQEELVYCYECSDHTVRKDEFSCLSCPANCHECKDSNKDDVTECTDCEDYFYKTSSETCDWCQGHCLGCDSDALGCDTCEERYYKTSGAISCDECTTGCERCEDSSTNGCFECYDGYFHIETSGSDIGTGTCTQCGANCLRCNNAQSCEECVTGTTWTGSSCTNCITNCDSDFCAVNGGCEQCIEGYSLVLDDPTNPYCLLCQNCAECPTTGGCTECEPRYILDEVYHTCDPCPALDTNAADCEVCGTDEQGRFLNSAGFCDYCIPNCNNCDGNGDTGGCDSNGCIGGYYFDNTDNSCGSCDSSCDTCDGPLSTDCTGCEDGERLDSGSCEVCNDAVNFVDNCEECNSVSCTECVDGYYLYIDINFGTDSTANTRGECRTCPDLESELEEYSTFQAICEDCSPDANRGRLWNGSPCQDCPTNCTSCDDNGDCEECMYHDHNYITSSGDCAYVDGTTFPGNCTILVQDGTGIGCRQCDPDYWYNGQDCNLASDYQSLLNTTSCYKFNVEITEPDENGGIPCLECAAGYYWDPDATPSGNCINAMIANCVALDTYDGTNVPDCIECTGAFYLDAGVCSAVTSTVMNCAAYSSATVCDECVDGYFLDTLHNYCVDCDSSDYDLLEEACRECNGDGGSGEGTYWVGSCQDCIENCVSCTSTTTCSVCADGYYYDSDNKVCTTLNCGSISHENACDLCSDEQVDSDDRAKFWSTSTCIDCPENCVDCSSETTCTTCAETYVWDSSRRKCVTCNFATETECENCWFSSSRGRWWDSTSSPPSCNICPSLCTACSSATVCTECVSSAFMSGDTCKACSGFSSFTQEECEMCTGLAWTVTDTSSSCQECGSNCATCLTNGGGKCDTDGCDSGYYYDITNEVCTLCISNCGTCSTGTTCDSNGCDSTFYRNDASTCTTCPSFCSTCVDSDGCTACQTGYYLDDSGNCQSCSVLSNCAACSSATTCTTCNDGYYKLTNDAGGVECTACIDGCAKCSAADSCDTCESQRCYDITGPACRSDPSQDCETCLLNDDDTLTCLTCPTGFNLQVCKGCISNCLVCSDSTTCDTCAGGFYKNTENTCTECPGPNCLECNDGTVCDDCGDTARWNTNSDACQDCPGTNCIDCGLSANDDWECKTCPNDAFYTEADDTQKLCNPCLGGCNKCSESTKETCDNGECAENYYQNVDNVCTRCPSGCAQCVEDAETLEVTCIACQDAYYMKTDGTCETCSTSFSNCAKCYDDDASDSIDQYECLECGGGYYMVDYEYECARCDLDNCAICVDPLSTCIDCGSSGTLGEDARQCGVECYLCDESYDGAICDQAPVFNVTRTGGCGPGYCITWVNITDGVSTYGRGCPPDLSNIGVDCGSSLTPTNEECFEIDADNKFCWSCCTDGLCNTNIVDGTAGAEAVFHFLQVSLLTAFLALVARVL